jgi:ABC-2 type transport system permease protein
MIRQLKIYSKINFAKEFEYRSAAISGTSTQVFFGLMQIMVFMAFYESSQTVLDFTLVQMSTYIWLRQIFYSMFKFYNSHRPIANQIVNGDISYQLIRPVELYNQWFFDIFTANGSKMIFRAPLVIIIAFLLPAGFGLVLPVSFAHFFLFALSIILGAILVVAIGMISYTLITITLSPGAVFGIVNTIASLLAGQIIPLPLFPKSVQTIVNFLPFRYTTDLPSRIYVGNITTTDAVWQICFQIVWIVAIIGFGKIFLNKRLNKLVVQGG